MFYFVATLSVLFALLVVFAKNPVHSVIYLILTFFTFTIHYILLNAQFLAAVNFIVYMGAIMVLFLFTLMLLERDKIPVPRSVLKTTSGVIAGMCLLATLIGALRSLTTSSPTIVDHPTIGLVKNLGKVLFTEFLLPFEISSLLLLVAMIGAVLLAKKETAA